MDSDSMNKKKKRIKNGILIIVSLILVAISLKGIAQDIFNSVFPPQAPKSINLSEEEKIEDFEYLYNTMVESIPSNHSLGRPSRSDLVQLEILEFQFGNWFWEGKIGIFNK